MQGDNEVTHAHSDFSLPENVSHVAAVAASIKEWRNRFCQKCSLPFKEMVGRRKVCDGQCEKVAACSLLLVVACRLDVND